MNALFLNLMNDEAGFVVSAELVLVGTIGCLGMLCGLSEVAMNVNNELEDVGTAVACVQQSYAFDGCEGHKAWFGGSSFNDSADYCDGENDLY